MLQEAIYKFKASGPMLLPELIDNYWIGEIKAYEDYAILPYEVHIPQPIDKVIDMFEMNADLAILYHLEPSVHTVFGHECLLLSGHRKDVQDQLQDFRRWTHPRVECDDLQLHRTHVG